MPDTEPTVAIEVLELCHVPPVELFVSVVVADVHNESVPDIADGLLFTVTTTATLLPHPVAYVIVAVPCAIPVTVPDELPTVAIEVLLLLQLPPVELLVSVVVEPVHKDAVPPIDAGAANTVTTLVAVPHMLVNEIIAVPCATPVTRPVLLPTVATDVLADVQLPTVVAEVSVVEAPAHNDEEPLTGNGASMIVCVKVEAGQPLPSVYVKVVDPTVTIERTPVEGSSMVATSILLLLHVPPAVVQVSVDVPVAKQTVAAPEIDAGVASTVIIFVAGVPQPFE
jgi:hypothetical protein